MKSLTVLLPVLFWLAFVSSASALSMEFGVTTNSLDQGNFVFAISTNAATGGVAFHLTITSKSGDIFDDWGISLDICEHPGGGSHIHSAEHAPQLALKKEGKVWKADFVASLEALKTRDLCLVFGGLAHVFDKDGNRVPYPAADMYEIKLADFVDESLSPPDLYLHVFASYVFPEAPRLVVSAPIHLGRDFDVLINDHQRVKGRIERRGFDCFAHFQGQLCSGPNVFDGEVEFEQRYEPWPRPYDAKAPFVCQPHFVLSTNSSPEPFLERQAAGEKAEHEAARNRPRQHYEAYLGNCKTNEIRCLWFLHDSPNIGMEMTINLDDYTVNTARDVYNWALQNQHTEKISESAARQLRSVANGLPKSQSESEFNKSVLVAMSIDGKVKVSQYDRQRAPAAVGRIYEISGGYFNNGKDQ